MALILLVAATVIFLLLLFLVWTYSYWYRHGIPQGNPLKLFGDLNDVVITFTPYWQHYLMLGKKFNNTPYYGAYSLGKRLLFIRDSDMIKDILIRKFSSFSENGFALNEETEPIIARDPFFQKGGERWKESRANFSSMMTPARLRNAILPEIRVVSEEAVIYLKEMNHESGKGDGTNAKNFAIRYMTNILVRVCLSLDAGCFKDEKSPFLYQAEHFFASGIESAIVPFLMLVVPQLGAFFGASFLSKEVRDFFEHNVQEQKQYRSENGIVRNDMLDLIIKRASEVKAQENDGVTTGKPVNPDFEALSLIIMFFFEGFETSATTISTTMASLAKHEEIQENLRREVLRVCPRGEAITEEALNSVPLLQNVILESLRLYPPAFMLQRVVTENVTLQAKTGEKIELKKGQHINIPIAALHRDPENFQDPEKFDPDRFEDENQKRLVYSFGDGPRQCPGQKFANLAMKTVIAAVLREFKLELSPKTKYPLEPISNPMIFGLKDVGVRFVRL